jgi:hypothetical protein
VPWLEDLGPGVLLLEPGELRREEKEAAGQGLWTSIREGYNFRGLGFTVAKSLLSRDVGLGVAIPVTPNFQVTAD